jgi:hypothetical protein
MFPRAESAVDEEISDFHGQLEIKVGHVLDILRDDFKFCLADKIPTFSSDADKFDRLAFLFLLLGQPVGRTAQIHVEATAQSLVGSDQNDAYILDDFTFFKQRMRAGFDAGSQIDKNVMKLISIGTKTLNSALSTAQFGRGNHIHSLGDLLGFLYAGDFVLNVPE